MQTLITNISNYIQNVYQKAGGFIEEEREFALSQVFLNATLKRFVTDNVGLLKDLHADVHDDWLRLYATINVQGLHTTLSVDLKLLKMELNNNIQLIVFEQISNTQIVSAKFKNKFQKWAIRSALFFYQKVLKKDPLGKILQHFNVLEVKDGLLHLDLNKWLGKNRSVIDTLGKVNVNHARLQETELVIMGRVNLEALMRIKHMAKETPTS
ncbi:hypothetical protein [Acinetobacter nectaris]|uniref:hypothetical protein n=1 Tax=Acinetobacter nectaris TaxID=1219382 RepID=UPI001F3BA76B|nr:hypothetical protein [Acinetobacter nectaris]MCF8999711.1 hypothetical protein [Acinetobacter nectaris]MCF9028210.1 hypothetical protein [Acinetobacter nectaris]